jgi:hypothetical protein
MQLGLLYYSWIQVFFWMLLDEYVTTFSSLFIFNIIRTILHVLFKLTSLYVMWRLACERDHNWLIKRHSSVSEKHPNNSFNPIVESYWIAQKVWWKSFLLRNVNNMISWIIGYTLIEIVPVYSTTIVKILSY